MPKTRVVRSLCVASILAAGVAGVGPAFVPAFVNVALAASHKPNPAPAPAKGGEALTGERIVAVVNDEVITASDVTARIRLGLAGSGMQDTPEVRDRLRSQIIRQLVDERLQMQEAKKFGALASDAEIKKALSNVASSNKMTTEQMEKFLAERGVPKGTLAQQVTAAISWHRVIQRRTQQEVQLGDAEVQAALDREKQSVGKPEYFVAEIFLGVDKPDQDAEVRRTAERLIEEIRRTGNFSGIARQFSQGAGAADGGDVGWVRQGDLGEEQDQALRSMRLGQVSAPVRSPDGYHIMLIRAQRTVGSSAPAQEAATPAPVQEPKAPPPKPDLARAKVSMKQIVFPAAGSTEEARKAAADLAEKTRKTIHNCADFDRAAKASGQPESGDMGSQMVKDLQPGLQQFVLGVPLGEPSPVFKGQAGAMMLIVCKRDVPMIQPPAPKVAAPAPTPAPAPAPAAAKKEDLRQPTREDVENRLLNEQAERVSRRLMRDLRRAAFIELRA